MGLIRNLTILGIVLPILLALFDHLNKESKHFKSTTYSLFQPFLRHKYSIKDKWNLIDPSKGTISYIGWDKNIQNNIFVNYEDATPLSNSFKWLNLLRFRESNFFIIYTKTHAIQFNLLNVYFACPTSLVIFEKDKDPNQSLLRVDLYNQCSNLDTHTLDLGNEVYLKHPKLNISIVR